MKPTIRPRTRHGETRFFLRYRIPGYRPREVTIPDVATLEEAWGAVATALPKIEKGVDPFIKDKPLKEWIEAYFTTEAFDLKPKTIANQRQVFRWWLDYLRAHHPRVLSAKDVTPQIVRAYRTHRLNAQKMIACPAPPEGKPIPPGVVKVGKQWKRPHESEKVSPRTWNLERSYLLTLFDYIARELIDYDNPVRPVDRAEDTKKRRPRIREDYLLPLLEEMAVRYSPRHALSLETQIACMLRPEEVAARRPADVDRFARVLWLSDTKTREDDSVALPDDLLPRLVELAKSTPKDAPLFPSQAAMRNAVRKTCAGLGIPPTSLYSARHTGISRALDNGALPHDVMRMARHKDFKTTQNYIHGSDAGKRRAANAASLRANPPKQDAEVKPLPGRHSGE